MATLKQVELKLTRINKKIESLTKEIAAAKTEKVKLAEQLKKAKASSKTAKTAKPAKKAGSKKPKAKAVKKNSGKTLAKKEKTTSAPALVESIDSNNSLN